MNQILTIFVSLHQKKIAEESKNTKQKETKNIIVTEIVEIKNFFLAEEYHQCYIKKNS